MKKLLGTCFRAVRVAIVLTATLCTFIDARADILLAQNGQTGYRVVVPDSPIKGYQFVSEDFRGLLSKATGASFAEVKLSEAPAEKRIFLGIAPEGVDLKSLPDQQWYIRTKNGDLYLYGGGVNGSRLAAYEFLEGDLGFRFFDARGGMRVPDFKKALRIKDLNRSGKPSFRYRYMNGESGEFNRPTSTVFLFRNGQNSWNERDARKDGLILPRDDFRGLDPQAHSIPFYARPTVKSRTWPWIKKIDTEDLFAKHPEYFTMAKDGKRTSGSQVCLSQRGLRDLVTERYLRNMDEYPYYNIFDLSAGDVPGEFCYCPDCQNLVKKYGTVAGPLVDFILELAPKAAAAKPDNTLMTLAYRKDQTQPPPKGIARMPDNFMPDFAPIDDNFAKDWKHPSNAQTYEDLKGWCRLCRDVTVWYYPNPYGGCLTPPLGNVERVATDMKLMHEAGVTGHMMEHNVGVGFMFGFTELQSYVIIRLMRDVTLDWRALADEFIDHQYGKAAEMFRRYWLELEELRKSTEFHLFWCASPTAYPYLTPERLLRWEADFDKMEAAVKDDPERLFNVQRVRANLDYALLTRFRACSQHPSGKNLSYDAVAGRFESVVKRAAETFCAERVAVRKKHELSKLRLTMMQLKMQSFKALKPLPRELFGDIPEERILETIPQVAKSKMEKDPDAAFGLTAVFTNNGRGRFGLPFPADFHDKTKPKPHHYRMNIAKVTKKDLGPRGQYKFYPMGEAVLSQDCIFRMGVHDSWDIKTDVGLAWKFGSFNRAKFYASLKFEGPAFYPEDAGKPNRVLCDRVVTVTED